MSADVISSLHNCYAFRDQSSEQLDHFSGRFHSATFNPHDYLYREGDPPKFAYLIQDGEWMTEIDHADGGRQVAGFGGVGELLGFGVMGTYVYSLKALTIVRSLKIAQNDFWKFVKDYPSIQYSLRKRANQITLGMYRQAAINAKLKGHERLCVLLQHIATYQNSDGMAQLNMTRHDIGDHLGLNVDSVSRAFKKLQKEKIIDMDNSGRQIALLDQIRIQELASII